MRVFLARALDKNPGFESFGTVDYQPLFRDSRLERAEEIKPKLVSADRKCSSKFCRCNYRNIFSFHNNYLHTVLIAKTLDSLVKSYSKTGGEFWDRNKRNCFRVFLKNICEIWCCL